MMVTGVSTGIGRDAARMLVERGVHVFGSVRSPVAADGFQKAFGDSVTPLLFDVSDPEAVEAARRTVEDRVGDQGLSGLVNNAGRGLSGPLQHIPPENLRRVFDVNVFGLIFVTQTFLPLLGARRNCPHPAGRIVNISSTTGRIALPFMGPYASTKHAVEGLSDSLRRELSLYGIKVTVIQPGPIRTPIWDKETHDPGALGDYAPYFEGFSKGAARRAAATALPVEKVTDTIERALFAPKPKPRYLVTPGFWTSWVLPRLLPDHWVDAQLEKVIGWRPLNRPRR